MLQRCLKVLTFPKVDKKTLSMIFLLKESELDRRLLAGTVLAVLLSRQLPVLGHALRTQVVRQVVLQP